MSDEKKPLLWVKLYATGKFTLHAAGGTEYDDKIESALPHSGQVIASFSNSCFAKL